MKDRVFVETVAEMLEYRRAGWSCLSCEGGYMCFRLFSDAMTWKKQR